MEVSPFASLSKLLYRIYPVHFTVALKLLEFRITDVALADMEFTTEVEIEVCSQNDEVCCKTTVSGPIARDEKVTLEGASELDGCFDQCFSEVSCVLPIKGTQHT